MIDNIEFRYVKKTPDGKGRVLEYRLHKESEAGLLRKAIEDHMKKHGLDTAGLPEIPEEWGEWISIKDTDEKPA